MKRLVLLLLAALLACGGASAEIVGRASDGGAIQRYLAPNGQELFFISGHENPAVTFEDVNLDGQEDIVVLTSLGASNAFYEFFVRQGDRYVPAAHPGIDYGLCNYTVQDGCIVTSANNGYAGALHEKAIWRWNGSDLELVRRAVSQSLETWDFSGSTTTHVIYDDQIHMCVWDYASSSGEGTVLWEATAALGEETPDLYAQEEAALWQDLR